MRIPRTTFGLAALMSLVLGALAVVAGWTGRHFAHEELERQLDHRIGAESSLLMGEHQRGGLDALTRAVNERHDRHEASGLGYLLVDSHGRRLAGSLSAQAPTEAGWREFLDVDRPGDRPPGYYQALTVVLAGGQRLVVAADRTPIDEIDSVIAWLTAGTTAAMLLLGVGSAWIIGLVTRQRIDAVVRVADAIAGGEMGQRIPVDGRAGEFERLAETLNRMLDRNAELLANLQQVSTDIAHDLLTPLSRHQQQLELALSRGGTVKDHRQAIERAISAATEIQQLFAAMLKISEIESLSLREDFNPISLSEIAERVGEAFRPDIEEGGRSLTVDLEPGVRINGEHHLLSQLMVNLVENAMTHTPVGTAIHIALRGSADGVELVIEDNGPGVPETELNRITERFVRLESSRSSQGHGLGLSLVKAIAAVHGARMALEDAGPGLCVRMEFRPA